MHLLVEQGNEDLSLTMQRVKGRVSAALRRAHPGMVVWQPGFHDRALRTDESVIRAARYLVANPIRAGLARGIGDYSFWDAVWLGDSIRGL
jgi:REP element-mobilizing transposase RayT